MVAFWGQSEAADDGRGAGSVDEAENIFYTPSKSPCQVDIGAVDKVTEATMDCIGAKAVSVEEHVEVAVE